MVLSIFQDREIFLQVGGFTVRWYGFLWALSFWLIWYVAPKLQKYRGLMFSQDEWTKIIAWGALGALAGGRIGYALFYEPAYFLQHPLEVLAFWHGGMASHGGFIGAAIAVWITTRKRDIFFEVLDVLTVPIALALALGRLGNWINLEIFGNNPIAIGKNLLIALVCYQTLRNHLPRKDTSRFPAGNAGSGLAHAAVKAARPLRQLADGGRTPMTDHAGMAPTRFALANGSVASIFLILYSVLRFLIEPLRDDPWPLVFGLTRGQLLTLPLFAMGVSLLIWLRKQKPNSKRPT